MSHARSAGARGFATEGRRLRRLARGIDDRTVAPDRGAKTISNGTTFETDIRDFATLEKILWRMAEKVSSRLKSGELSGSTTGDWTALIHISGIEISAK
jgi:DNA polymerase IV